MEQEGVDVKEIHDLVRASTFEECLDYYTFTPTPDYIPIPSVISYLLVEVQKLKEEISQLKKKMKINTEDN